MSADGWVLEGNVFRRESGRYLPPYEAKMTQPWDHRAADVIKSPTAVQRQAQPRPLSDQDHYDPYRCAQPMYWVSATECLALIPSAWKRQWLCGFTNVTSPTNERTFLPALIPVAAVGNSLPLMFPMRAEALAWALVACTASFAFDYVTRQNSVA